MVVQVLSLLLHIQWTCTIDIPSCDIAAAPHAFEDIGHSIRLCIFEQDLSALSFAAADALQVIEALDLDSGLQ